MTDEPTKVELGNGRVQKLDEELGPQDPLTIGSRIALSLELQQAGRLSDAERVLHAAFDACLQIYGTGGQETIRVRSLLAAAMYKQNRYDDAQRHQDLVIEYRATALGREHPLTLASRCTRARILHDAGRQETARQEAGELLDVSASLLSFEHEGRDEQTIRTVRDSVERLLREA